MAVQSAHTSIRTNGVTLHVVTAGPPDGPLVLLLHGFPEFWYGWRCQIDALASGGYHLLVPDQRGYGLSEKPQGLAAYTLDRLAADVVGLIAASGRDRAAVVGHDWGAAVAWWLGIRHPTWLERLGILNGPHPMVMSDHLRHHPAQLRRSWYIFYFQLPWLPEWSARAGNWRAAVRALRDSSRRGTFTDADLDRYREAWSRPGAFTAMLNWYRAILRHPPRLPRNPRVTVPTLIIWGAQDLVLGRELAVSSVEYCDRGRLVLIEEASHWVHHEEPERVNGLLLDFLAEGQ